MIAPTMDAAPRCLRCWRPDALCYCRALEPAVTRTHVVIFQHPRERAMKMGTARLAHLGLAGSELHVGMPGDDHPRVRALAAAPPGQVALLYPAHDGASSHPPGPPPQTLVIVDGTWSTARKMLAHSRLLRELPRLALQPATPSTYRIRREPAAHCLSTVEAIVAALVELEGDAARFTPLLAAFAGLIDRQIDYARTHHVPYRRERPRRPARHGSPRPIPLAAPFERLVVTQAEGNPRGAGSPHEVVQLVAERVATGERFASIVRPRRPLGALTPARLGLAQATLDDGDSLDDARAAWRAFLDPDDVLVGWGTFTPTVLAAEAFACPPWIDLRGESARRLGRRPGGTDAACDALDAPDRDPWAPGRAGARLASLARLALVLSHVPKCGKSR